MVPLINLFVILSNLLLGLITLSRNPKASTNILFFALTLILSCWTLTNYFSFTETSPQSIYFWLQMVMVITSALFPVIYLLTKTFPYKEMGVSKIKLSLVIAAILVTQLVVVLGFTFKGVTVAKGVITPIPGPGIVVYALNAFGFFTLAFITLYRKSKQLVGLEKVQLNYLILGISTTFILSLFTNFILVNFFKITFFVSLGPSFSLIMVGLIAYAVIKHKFLDISLVIARTVSFTLLTVIVGLIYAIIFGVLSSLTTGNHIEIRAVTISTLLMLVMAFAFQPVRHLLERATDSFLYKNGYDTSKLLDNLTHIMASTLEFSELTQDLLQKLLEEMKVSRGAFILNSKNSQQYQIVGLGYKPELAGKGKELERCLGSYDLIIFDEQPEGEAKELMRDLKISLMARLFNKDREIGVLVLGEKLSGDIYSSTDIGVLKILSPEISIAINNAESYDEIRKFNITLTQEIQKATSQLKQANLKLEELDQLKDDFVSVASHELRTPMTAIRSYAWMALHRSDVPLSDKLKKYLTRTFVSTERLINLVNELLNISRIESGRIEILPEVMDIRALVDEVLIEVGPRAAEKSLNLRIYSTLVPKVYADIDKVHQVLLNLIGNAMKFTPNGGDITLSFFSDGYTVDVAVKDTGVGITREDLSRLFKKFGRLDNSYVAAATSGGTGLGLYISKSLIERMGGRIWAVSSGLGKGSIFTFSLPVASKEVLAHAEKFSNRVTENQVKYLEPVAI